MTVEAVLAPDSFGWVRFQLGYDGRTPPVAILDVLARSGWVVPPPPARPASAIDWTMPDPVTGARFTVRPWRAVHEIGPPGRYQQGAGRWDPASRVATLRGLADLLGRYGVTVVSSVAEVPSTATTSPVTTPSAQAADLPARRGGTAVNDSGDRPGPSDPLGRPEPDWSSTQVLVVAHVDLVRVAEGSVARLRAHPVLAGSTMSALPASRPVVRRYRGALAEVACPCVRIEVWCHPEQVAPVRALLAVETGSSVDEIGVGATGPAPVAEAGPVDT